MANITRTFTANLGAGQSNLSTVNYQILDSTFTVNTAWTGTGVTETPYPSGIYSVTKALSDDFCGIIEWRTNSTNAKYASEDIKNQQQIFLNLGIGTVQQGRLDVAVSSRSTLLNSDITTDFLNYGITTSRISNLDNISSSPLSTATFWQGIGTVPSSVWGYSGSKTIQLDTTQSIGSTHNSGTLGELLAGQRADSLGKWVISNNVFYLYDTNNVLLKSFTLTPSGGEYDTRTPI